MARTVETSGKVNNAFYTSRFEAPTKPHQRTIVCFVDCNKCLFVRVSLISIKRPNPLRKTFRISYRQTWRFRYYVLCFEYCLEGVTSLVLPVLFFEMVNFRKQTRKCSLRPHSGNIPCSNVCLFCFERNRSKARNFIPREMTINSNRHRILCARSLNTQKPINFHSNEEV